MLIPTRADLLWFINRKLGRGPSVVPLRELLTPELLTQLCAKLGTKFKVYVECTEEMGEVQLRPFSFIRHLEKFLKEMSDKSDGENLVTVYIEADRHRFTHVVTLAGRTEAKTEKRASELTEQELVWTQHAYLGSHIARTPRDGPSDPPMPCIALHERQVQLPLDLRWGSIRKATEDDEE